MLHSLLDFSHSLCYPQSNWAPLALIPSGWACARSRPLWVSSTNSPVRLRVSPAAASTPTGVFNQRFEALFPPRAGALGWAICFASPPFLPVYLCENVGPRGLLAVTLPALFLPQSATSLRQSVRQPPSHTVQFSVSSGCFLFLNWPSFGCTRRQRVSTYTSILAGSLTALVLKQNSGYLVVLLNIFMSPIFGIRIPSLCFEE